MYEIPDKTGRFSKRPFYQQVEIDRECEDIISRFLVKHRGKVDFPVSTDDLETLVEAYADDLDPYGNLTSYGEDVEGVTLFSKSSRPKVIISEKLHEDSSRENRYRTTLAHEFGHVHFHSYLFSMDLQQPLWTGAGHSVNQVVCKRDNILDAPQKDWMEWQAGYVCSSLLMPITPLNRFVGQFRQEFDLLGDISASSSEAITLIERAVRVFQVSRDAARVRLSKLGILCQGSASPSLFS